MSFLYLVTIGWELFWCRRAWGWVYVCGRIWTQSVQDIMIGWRRGFSGIWWL